MDLIVRVCESRPPGLQETQVAERKGLGHPKTAICGGIAACKPRPVKNQPRQKRRHHMPTDRKELRMKRGWLVLKLLGVAWLVPRFAAARDGHIHKIM